MWYYKFKRSNITCDLPQPYNKIGDGPEAPEVFCMTQRLRRRFPVGHSLVEIRVFAGRYQTVIPRIFLNKLPLKITEIGGKGKKTFVKFNKQWSLLISYGMSGHWRTAKSKFTELELIVANPAGFRDSYFWTSSRSLPTCSVQFLKHAELQQELDRLGIDIVRDDPTIEDVLTLFEGTRQNICAFLMDQGYFCGIGNYVCAVILYRCEISPHRKVHELDDGEKWSLWETAKEVAQEAIAAKGMGIRDYRDEDGKVVGVAFDITPYNCKKDKHGNSVKAEKIGGRTRWWVPVVQV